jgi:hypothetical protein
LPAKLVEVFVNQASNLIGHVTRIGPWIKKIAAAKPESPPGFFPPNRDVRLFVKKLLILDFHLP